MATDHGLSDINIPAELAERLEEVEIRSARQLYARLRHEPQALQAYLQLSDEEFGDFYRRVEDVIKAEYPEDLLPRIRPQVNKKGVAAHRLNDPTRPRYKGGGED